MKRKYDLTRASKFIAGMGVNLEVIEDGCVTAAITLDDRYEGPPGHVHGGVLTSLLDEAMGMAVWSTGKPVLAVNLNVNFRRPVPLGIQIALQGKIENEEGRKAFTIGTITLPDGKIAVEGAGIFVEAPESIVKSAKFVITDDE